MNKQELNTKYGKLITDVFKSGKTYIDTDSFKIKPVHVVSHDNALCMYDYAKEIIEVLDNEKG